MNKDFRIHLIFIVECTEIIEKYLQGLSFEKFLGDIKVQDALIRRIELIGEAVRNIPDRVREESPRMNSMVDKLSGVTEQSRPARARGLKHPCRLCSRIDAVAPRAGAWIETLRRRQIAIGVWSRPARARGLKQP